MIAALVPAAGCSARMGRPKLLFEFNGQSLIGLVVSALRSGGAECVVVVAPPCDAAEGPAVAAEARRAGAEVIVPRTRPGEMRESIELGLERLARNDTPQSVLLTPGDYPGINAEIVGQLVQYRTRMPDRIVIPSHNGRRGHPIVLPWAIAAQVPSLPRGAGVNALVAQNGDIVVELEVASPEIVYDLDTPADLQHWEQRQNSGARTEKNARLPIPDSRFQRRNAEGPSGGSGFRVCVRLFAVAKERAGHAELEIELIPGSKVADLRAALGKRVPALGPLLSTVMIAVDEEYAGDDVAISPCSRLAVIPPVSGGTGGGSHATANRSRSGGVFLR
jgi:molybdenum cofactor cytidylyltransferase